jgi:hypothetical protein
MAMEKFENKKKNSEREKQKGEKDEIILQKPEPGWEIANPQETKAISTHLYLLMRNRQAGSENLDAAALHQVCEFLRNPDLIRGAIISRQEDIIVQAFELLAQRDFGRSLSTLDKREIKHLTKSHKLSEMALVRLSDAYFHLNDSDHLEKITETILSDEKDVSTEVYYAALQNYFSFEIKQGNYLIGQQKNKEIMEAAERYNLPVIKNKARYGEVLSNRETSLKGKIEVFRQIAKELFSLNDPADGNRAQIEQGILQLKLARQQRFHPESYQQNLKQTLEMVKKVETKSRNALNYPVAEIGAIYARALVHLEYVMGIMTQVENNLNKKTTQQSGRSASQEGARIRLDKLQIRDIPEREAQFLLKNLQHFQEQFTKLQEKMKAINYFPPKNYEFLQSQVLQGGAILDEENLMKRLAEWEILQREKERAENQNKKLI